MKNVTISMDEELLREARIEAAKAGLSMSRYLSTLIQQSLHDGPQASREQERERRMKALERFLNGPKLPISENGRMPTAEERNARR